MKKKVRLICSRATEPSFLKSHIEHCSECNEEINVSNAQSNKEIMDKYDVKLVCMECAMPTLDFSRVGVTPQQIKEVEEALKEKKQTIWN